MKTAKMICQKRRIRPASRRRGVATVEMAMLLPPLIMLLFGTIELGMMAKQSAALNHVAREAARVASIGATVSRIESHMAQADPGLNPDSITVALDYRAWDQASGTWGTWVSLTDDGVSNNALNGDQIRVQLQYPYELVTGRLLAGPLNASEDNVVMIDATIVSMRE